MKRLGFWVLAAIVFGGALGLVITTTRVVRAQRQAGELARLARERDRLHQRLTELLDRDPVVARAREDSSRIAVALSESLMVAIIHQTTATWFDRVELNLANVKGRGKGEFDVDTPFGDLTVGAWKVQVLAHEVEAVLAAGTPEVAVSGDNRIGLAIPIHIRQGEGRVTLKFRWDSKSVFNLICRDFETVQMVRGNILPQTHVVRGSIVLAAGKEGIVADPDFPRERYPLGMTLTEGSWDQIRDALKEQDKLMRCGLLVNPDSAVKSLHALGTKGLKFRLPKSAFRTIYLPAGLVRTVRILGAPIDLVIEPHELRITPGWIWYGAEMKAHRSEPDLLPRGARTPGDHEPTMRRIPPSSERM